MKSVMNTVNLLGQEGYILLMQRVYMQTFKPTTGLKKKKGKKKHDQKKNERKTMYGLISEA